MDDFKHRDPTFDEIRNRLNKAEARLTDLMLTKQMAEAAAQLAIMPAWKTLVQNATDLMDKKIQKLKTEDLSPYWLGHCQGYVRAIEAIRTLRQLDDGELAKLDDDASLLVERITELRTMLQ